MDVDIDDRSKKIKQAIIRGIERALLNASDRIVEHARNRAPTGDTGTLQRMISSSDVRFDAESASVTYGSYAPYSAAVEFGTAGRGEPFGSSYVSEFGANDWPRVPPGKQTFGPYVIRPKHASALKFKVGGKEVFAKQVIHPGVRARPFMRPAIDEVRHVEFQRLVIREVRESIKRAAGIA